MAFFITHVIAIIFELLSISFGRPLGFGFGFTVAVVLNDIFVHDEIRENERKKYIKYIEEHDLIDEKKEGECGEPRKAVKMMRETKVYCDHCGKVLDEKFDYNDTEIDFMTWFKCDLCAECIDELDKFVLKFCKKGGEHE